MPISPERMKLYPGGSIRSPEWRAIRAEIIQRAGNRCEGSDQFPGCRVENGKTHPETGARVVLTIGHVNHDEADCRPENLKAWCQRCHLNWDAKHHAANARETRDRKSGQMNLFERKQRLRHDMENLSRLGARQSRAYMQAVLEEIAEYDAMRDE